MNPHEESISAEALLAEAGFLRRLARGLVADEHTAADLAQETMLVALERPPRGGSLRAWLATVAANLARNARRGRERSDRRERAVARPERLEGELPLERLELQRGLFELVLALPAEQRTVVYLRFYEELGPAAIAERLGVPPKTVKSRLTRALAALRERLDARSGGDRRVWMAVLVPLASPRAVPWSGTIQAAIGGVAMKKLVVAGVALVVTLLAWRTAWSSWLGERWRASGRGGEHVVVRPLETKPAELAPAPADDVLGERRRQPRGESSPATTGALRLTFLRAGGTPAGDLPFALECMNDPAPRVEPFRARTGADGTALVPELFAGPVRIWSSADRFEAEVEAGATRALVLTLAESLTVAGTVVDPDGTPVAGAEIWRGQSDTRWPGGFLLATSGGDGIFRLRDVDAWSPIGARRRGHLPSQFWRPGELPAGANGTRSVQFVLGARGGGLRGRVLDPEGQPLAHASVMAGPDGGWVSSARPGVAPEPAFAETDEQGEFELRNDLASGKHPIHASARGFPVWRGEVELIAGQTSSIEIRLERPARIEGRLLGIDGAPAAGVEVLASEEDRGGWYHDRLAPSENVSDEQGWFVLDWVAPGLRELNAHDWRRAEIGRARASVLCAAGETATCELRLERGNVIAGTLVDGAGAPLAGWRVEAETSGFSQWYERRAETGTDGRFELLNLGDGNHDLVARAPELGPPRASASGVPVGTRDVVLVAADAHARPGTVHGRLLDLGAQSLADVEVTLWLAGGREGQFLDLDPGTGTVSGSAPPGRYSVGVRRGERELHRSAEFDVVEGAETDLGAIELGELGRVEVALTGFPAGQLENLRLSLERADRSYAELEFSAGLWRAEDVMPGRWTVTTHESELFLRGGAVEVEPGATARVEVAVEPAIHVQLTYVDPAQSWITLEARDPSGTLLRFLRTRPVPRDGRSRLSIGLPSGRAELFLRTEDGRSATLTFDVSDALRGADPLELELR